MMMRSAQLPRPLLTIAVASTLGAPVVAASTIAAACKNIQILSEQLTAREAEAYCRYAVIEREKVKRLGVTLSIKTL
jgi:hypothetical protein